MKLEPVFYKIAIKKRVLTNWYESIPASAIKQPLVVQSIDEAQVKGFGYLTTKEENNLDKNSLRC